MKKGSPVLSPRAWRRACSAAALLVGSLLPAGAAAQGPARPAPAAASAGPSAAATATSSAMGTRAMPAPSGAPVAPAAPLGGPRAAASAAPLGGPRAAASAAPAARLTAEPAPSMTRKKWAYDVRLKRGQLSAAAPLPVDRGRPLATPRLVGRFAIELFVGSLLLERVRFDLPLVDGGPSPKAAPDESPKALSTTLSTHRVVEVPDLERATRAELVDVVTGKRLRLVWPPVDGAPSLPSAPVPAAPPGAPAAPPAPSSSPPRAGGR